MDLDQARLFARTGEKANIRWVLTSGGTQLSAVYAQKRQEGIVMVRVIRASLFLALFLLPVLSSAYAAEWVKTYGSLEEYKYHRIFSGQQTSDGGYIMAGHTGSRAPNTIHQQDMWVMKLNSNGTVAWQKAYGGAEVFFVAANSIQQTLDGGYIVAGQRDRHARVLKLNSDGTIAWQKSYGGESLDYASSIQQTPDGGYVVAGGTRIVEGAMQDIVSAWVLKLNSNGTVAWQKTFGGVYQLHVRSLHLTSDGGYIIPGYIRYPDRQGFFNAWVLKLNSDGTIDWQKAYGGVEYTDAHSIQQTPDGGYVVAGTIQSRAWVLKLKSNGDVAWQKSYDVAGRVITDVIQRTLDGGYIVGGRAEYYPEFRAIALILKLDAYGNIPSCSIESSTSADVSDAPATAIASTLTTTDTLVNPQTPSAASTMDTNVIVTKICPAFSRIPKEAVFSWREWMNYLMRCLQWPGDVGVGVPQRCQPVGCLDCRFRFSQYQAMERIPPYLHGLYPDAQLLWFSPKEPKIPENTAKGILKSVDTVPVGSHFTDKMKTVLQKELKDPKTPAPRLLDMLAEAINAIELDLSVPPLSRVNVKAGKYSAADLEGIAWLAFRDLKKSGKASLRILNGLPAAATGFVPVWPMASYQFEFTGMLDKDGYIDIGFYIGGISIPGPASDLRVLEWDGRSYRDITTNVDLRRGVITGRTNRLSTYVIMDAGSSGKVFCEKCGR